ncbi:MAG: cysteine--tRNA ligase [Patescibacteria group bacterium]
MFRIYNTLTKQKEEFKPINPGKVSMYVCGPTVYDFCHLGHARGYVAIDVLRRYLEYSGYEVRHIMNYTDVGHLVDNAEIGEDKIEKRARAEKIDPIEIANKFIKFCEDDFGVLNIKPAHFNPRPTKYIAQIIKFNEELIKKGFAYESNGSVYFSVDKFPEYGKLSGKKKEDLLSGARVEINPEKKNPLDFALWIKAPKEHILKWESPWGIGYPGWHIECSVMSYDLLGQDTFDIHGGGNENAFPHNENEIAQSEAYLGKKMANFWFLWNMVQVDGQKMSKSLGNFTTIKDAIEKYGAMVVKLWILSSHYRSITNFSEDAIEQARVNFQRISDFVNNLKNSGIYRGRIYRGRTSIEIKKYQEKFEEAMNDDLNTPLALSVLYELITETNKSNPSNTKEILSLWEKMNKVFGLTIPERKNIKIGIDAIIIENENNIPLDVEKLIEKRFYAKKIKDFVESDKLRELIEKRGYSIEDTKKGLKVKVKLKIKNKIKRK